MLRKDPLEYERIYLNGEPRQKEGPRQIDGMLLHDLLLCPSVVQDKYIQKPKVPHSLMMRTYIQQLAEMINYHLILNEYIVSEDIAKYEQAAYNRSEYTESLETIKEKAKQYKAYMDFCMAGKLGIDAGQIDRINALIDKNYKSFNKRLKLQNIEPKESKGCLLEDLVNSETLRWDEEDGKEYYYEMLFKAIIPLNSRATGKRTKVAIIGMMDHVKIDISLKEIIITDIKKVENVLEFSSFYEERQLDIQAGVYLKALEAFSKGWKIYFEFLVVDDSGRYKVFSLSPATKAKIITKVEDDIDKAYYHIKMKRYGFPYEYLNEIILL